MRLVASFTLILVSSAASASGSEDPSKPVLTLAAEALRDGDDVLPGEEIVVTATRNHRPIRDVPAAVTVVPRAEIERNPAKTLDELLLVVPSFALFRRSSSLAADPSSQGVTLRGVGPSGVSRSLVLVDGIPANDPFGRCT